ncbi:MAG: hypothetical protein DHS20C18_13970 [Saprospiraceae bacterium]|nr:MAG: hypothetical protein DHS20C18_13970 [Saprospiraceae bacterium]
MTIIQSVEFFVAINLLVMGLSHFLQPKMWVDFFVFLHAKQGVGNILNALLSLTMGSVIIAFHFIWEWPKILVTLYGLLSLIKGGIYLLKPSIGIASIGKVNLEGKNKFRGIGLVMVILAVGILFGLIMEGAF